MSRIRRETPKRKAEKQEVTGAPELEVKKTKTWGNSAKIKQDAILLAKSESAAEAAFTAAKSATDPKIALHYYESAKECYEKAAQYGSTKAPKKIEELEQLIVLSHSSKAEKTASNIAAGMFGKTAKTPREERALARAERAKEAQAEAESSTVSTPS